MAGAAMVLAVVVLVPRIIAGEVVQAELRRLVAETAGAELDVRGRIGVSIFPRLRISLGRAELPTALRLPEPIPIHADRLELDVAPLPLLAGRLEVRRVRAVRPQLALPEGATAAAIATGALDALTAPGLSGLASIHVLDGRLERAAARGGPGRALVENLNGLIRRDALLRRLGATLTGTAGDAPLEVRAEAGEAASGRPATLSLGVVHGGRGGHHARLQFQGFGTLAAGSSELKGRLELQAAEAGDLWALAHLLSPERPPDRLPRTAPILAAGDVELTPAALTLSSLGAQLGPNTVEISGRVALADRPELDLDIAASELTPDPATLGDLRWLLQLPWRGAEITGRATVQVDLVRWRDQPIQQLRAELRLAPDGAVVDRLSAMLPGTADLGLSGHIRPDGASSRFEGRLSLSAEDARATLLALGVPPESLPPRGLRAVVLSSPLAANRASVALRDFELRMDGARIRGSAALIPGARPRLALSATADRLDLALYCPDPAVLDPAGLRDRLTTFDATLDLTAGHASMGELWAQGLYLRLSLEQGLLRLAQLSVRDLAEAQLSLSGTADLLVESFQLAGQVETSRPARLLRAVGFDPPPTITRLAPVRITGSARGSRDAAEVELSLDADGADGRLNASLAPWLEPTIRRARVEASADRLEELLRHVGLVAGERPGLARPARLTGRLEEAEEGYRLALQATALPTDLAAELSIGLQGDVALLAGKVGSRTADRDLLQALLELAPLAAGAPSLRTLLPWLGRLPDARLGLEHLRHLDLDLELSTERLLGFEPAGPAAARLRVAEGLVTVDGLRLPVAGGTLAGVITLAGVSSAGTLGLDLRLTEARAEQLLAGLGIGSGGLAGKLALEARMAASGRSMAELVGTLEGEADLRIEGGSLPPLQPGPASAPLPFVDLAGRLTAERGILKSTPPLALTLPSGQGEVQMALDLTAWITELAVTLPPSGAEDDAAAVRRFVGPPDRLRAIATEPAELSEQPALAYP